MEMEKFPKRRINKYIAAAMSAIALTSCASGGESAEPPVYLNDPTNVRCDGLETRTFMPVDGTSMFIVHGDQDQPSYPADITVVKVRREDGMASVGVVGNVTGPPQVLEANGMTTPTEVIDGPELVTFGAKGVWTIDVSRDDVIISGSCDGL